MPRLRSDCLAITAHVCLLSLFLSLSGCGAIFDFLMKNRERETDESICREKCQGFKESGDYAHCYNTCLFERSAERSRLDEQLKEERQRKKNNELEEAERSKQLTDKVDKVLRKTN